MQKETGSRITDEQLGIAAIDAHHFDELRNAVLSFG
jgi:hypothetical protein